MLRVISAGLVTLMVVGLVGAPSASAQQQVSFSIGGFSPRSADGRPPDDVLVNNLDFLAFQVSDFSGLIFSGEYLTALGDHFDAGLGVGYYAHTVPTVYNDFVNANGTEIQQDLRLRIVPFTATVRWLPLGHPRHRAVRRRRRRHFQLPLQRGRAVSRDRRVDLQRQLRRQRHVGRSDHPRRRSRSCRVLGRGRRTEVSVGGRHASRGSGLFRQQDRSGRVHLYVHHQCQVLSPWLMAYG